MRKYLTIEELKDDLLRHAVLLALKKTDNKLASASELLGISSEDLKLLAKIYCIEIEQEEESNFVDFGKIYFKDYIAFTDPCYSKDIYLEDIHQCKSGKYNCSYTFSDEGDWGKRVAVSQVVHEDYNIEEDDLWENVGYIGVDSGTAGFFENKPDFESPDSWGKVCDMMRRGDAWKHEKDWTGFWTSSGYGDGSYDIFVVRENDEIIAAKIVFI